MSNDLEGAKTQLDNYFNEMGYKLDSEDRNLRLSSGIRVYEAQEIYEKAKLNLEKLARIR